MKSKILIAAILLNLLIIIPIFSQESKNYNQIVRTEFGIDLNKNYSGEDVADIIAICLEEKDIAIEEAYAEGYKQGVLEYAPDVEYFKKQTELLNRNNEILKDTIHDIRKNNSVENITCFGLGFLSGGITGGLITLKLIP